MAGDGVTPGDVLRVLDERAAAFDFPVLDNPALEVADMRLTAFRSPDDWLVVFQEVGVLHEDAVVDVLSPYAGGGAAPRRALDRILLRPDGTPLLQAGRPTIDVWAFTLTVHGVTHQFTPAPADLAAAGITDPHRPAPLALLRLVCRLQPGALFLPDDGLPAGCGRGDDAWRVVLRASRWHHPDVAAGEAPSASPCLRSLAEALATGEPERYHCPQGTHNTPAAGRP